MLRTFFFSVALAAVGEGANRVRIELPNPLGGTETVAGVVNNIIGALQIIAIPLVALMVLVGGYQILFAAGNQEKFKTGKQIILYAVIGYAILLLSGGVAALIENILK